MGYEKVLIIDFDSITKNVIRDTLKKQGYGVSTIDVSTESAKNVSFQLKNKIIDILIINLTLPGINSIELMQQARLTRPGIGIIALSQNDSRDVIIKAFQEGAYYILEKPFNAEKLIKIVTEVLEKSRLAKENIRLKTLLPLFKLTESLVSELSFDKISNDVVNLVYMETRANRVSILLLDEKSQRLTIKASIGLPKDQLGKGIDMSDDSIAWAVIKSGQPLLIKGEPKSKKGANAGITTTLCVPLSIKGRTIGVINCSKTNARNSFSVSDQELLSILAVQATIAIENARLFNNVKGHQNKLESSLIRALTAQEDERSRISAELHDGLAQWLVSASYCMQLVDAQISLSNLPEARSELSLANDFITQSVKELRRILLDLHPIALSELGLIGALQQSIDYFNKENGTFCSFKIVGDSQNLSFINDVTIYRVTLEALNNIRKHAHAHNVDYVLEFNKDHVIVNIKDDGVGFDLEEINSKKVLNGSLGLVTMKERTEMIGGIFDIQSAPGKGTKIFVKLPARSN